MISPVSRPAFNRLMQKIIKNPRVAGAIAALYQKLGKSGTVVCKAEWQKDGLLVRGIAEYDHFEGLFRYNPDGELVVEYFATWRP